MAFLPRIESIVDSSNERLVITMAKTENSSTEQVKPKAPNAKTIETATSTLALAGLVVMARLDADFFYAPLPKELIVDMGRNLGTHPYDVEAMTVSTRIGVFAYGGTKITGDGGSSPAETATAEYTVEQLGVLARVAAIQDGSHNFGKGGSTRSDLVKELTTRVVEAVRKAFGLKAGKAKKWVSDKGLETAYRAVIHARVKAHVDGESLDAEKIFVVRFDAMKAEAMATVRSRRAVDSDLLDGVEAIVESSNG